MTKQPEDTRGSAFSRRRAMKLYGLVMAGAMSGLAGCLDTDEPDDDVDPDDMEPEPDDTEPEPEPEPDDTEPEPDDEEEPDDMEPEPDDEEEPDDTEPEPDDEEEPTDPSEWEDVEEVILEARAGEWLGVSPDPIRDEVNPTLVLFDGREYEVIFGNMDGEEHNFVIRDADGEVLEESDMNDEEATETSLEFTANHDMAEYVSEPNEDTQVGEIQVEDNGEVEPEEENGEA